MSAMDSALRRVRLVVAYDGGAYHGFARNPIVPTVANTLERVLSLICRLPVEVVGAGRTDAGVHAWGQVVSADVPADLDLVDVQRRINKMCGPTLVVRTAEWAPTEDFHARFDAIWRHYRYTILNSPTPNPFLAATTWHVRHSLDLRLMELATDPFVGEHDFASFCRKPRLEDGRKPRSTVRRLLIAEWSDLGDGLLRFDIRANAFCHQQVRAIVGTLVEVGLGKRKAGEMAALLRARDRRTAGQVAPAVGLCLWEVGYPELGTPGPRRRPKAEREKPA
ncbi:MAG: tRNA pseudouridine(38-40) synthase TruA [Actinobacteria bacterium]|nr:tRNA pseudouridine(38-40) synthase TruA [Actinomycetota bacterium]